MQNYSYHWHILLCALTFSFCAVAQTNINPHPFTVHDVEDHKRQVVYFSTETPIKKEWKEDYKEDKRILGNSEWDCLLNEREFKGIAATNFRGWAQLIDEEIESKVKNAYAVLLPDDWADMYYFDSNNAAWYKDAKYENILFNIGSTFSSNSLKKAEMDALQQAGAVFLPCDMTAEEGVHAEGQYWTKSMFDEHTIYYVHFATSSTDSPEPTVEINSDGIATDPRYVLLAEPEVTITLDENEDNAELLTPWATHHQPVNVKLIRSLTPGMYNTFCLPFDLNAKYVKDVFGETTKLAKFKNGTLSDDKTTLNIEFEDINLSTDDATAIEAGTPYLIQPGDVVTNPTFKQCVIERTAAVGEDFSSAEKIEYLGIINPHHIPDGNKRYLFLQANNNLIWSKKGDTSDMKGMRGYFYVPDMQDMSANCPARLSVRQALQTPDDLKSIDGSQCTMHKGKFLINGQLIIVKDNKMFNAQGARIATMSR